MPVQDIHRSGRSILSFQLQGLCNGLRIAIQSGQPAGPICIDLLSKMQVDLATCVKGRCMDGLPSIDKSASTADLLIYAEVLNETLNSFLSPEEGEEKRKFFGFDQVNLGLGPLSIGLGR